MDISHDWQTILTRHGHDIEKAHDKIRVVESGIETIKGKVSALEAKSSGESSIEIVKQLLARQHDLLQHHSHDAKDGFAEHLVLLQEMQKKQATAFTALSHRITVLFGLLFVLSVLNLIVARFL